MGICTLKYKRKDGFILQYVFRYEEDWDNTNMKRYLCTLFGFFVHTER